MKKIINILFALSAASFLLTGCIGEMDGFLSTKKQEAHKRIPVSINIGQILMTRTSTAQGSETIIKNITIAVYRDGVLDGQTHVSNVYGNLPNITMNLLTGCTYNIYALANIDNASVATDVPQEFQDSEGGYFLFPCTKEEYLIDLIFSYGSFNEFADYNAGAGDSGFPMDCILKNVQVYEGMAPIQLALKRHIARINFKFDNTGLPGLSVTSVKLRQAPLEFHPFPDYDENGNLMYWLLTSFADGDHASTADLENLNSGRTISFYMLPNPAGDIGNTGTDEWNKVIGGDGTNAEDSSAVTGGYTYLEVKCHFDGTTNYRGNVTYRYLLGHDNYNDCNIDQNDDITVTMYATQAGLSRVSWKVDVSELSSDPIPFTLNPPKYIAQKGTLDLSSVPAGFTVSLASGSTVLSNDNVSIVQTSSGHYSISGLKASKNTLYLNANGYTTQTATFEVKGPELKFEKSSYDLTIDGTPVTATAHYYDRGGNILSPSDFDATLYSQLLAFDYSCDYDLSDYLLEYPIGNSGNAYHVERLTGLSSNSTYDEIDDYFGSTTYLFAKVTPASSYKLNYSDTRTVTKATAHLVVLNPFPTASSTLGRIDNTAFVAGGIVNGSVLNVNLTTQANNIGWTIEEDTPTINSDFTSDKRGFNISSDGSKLNFTCRGTAFITQTVSGNRTFSMYHYPCGHCKVKGSLTNSHSNQSWVSPDYYVNIYEHVQLFGQIYGVRWVANNHSFNGAYAYMEVRGEFSPAHWSLAANRPAIGNYIWSNKNGTVVDPQGGYCFVGFPATQAAVNFKDGEDKGLYALFNYDAQGRFGNTTDNGESSGNLDFVPGSSASDATILSSSWTAAQRDQYMSTHIPEVYMDKYLNDRHTSDPDNVPFPYEVKNLSGVTQYVIVDVVNVRQMGSYNSARTWMSPVDYETITVQ